MNTEQIRERINTMFSGLNFDSRRHLYFVEGINYPSVSSLVDTHARKVDFESILPHSAAKKGVSVEELRQEWKRTNKTACDLGTDTHDFLEHFTGLEQPKTPQEKAGIKFLVDIQKDYEIVAREIRMYTRKYQYAGTSDLLLRHKVSGGLVIADYKTNKDLFKAYDNLKHPFSFFEASPYNKYQIQLSYYQIMLEEANLFVDQRMLVALREGEDKEGEYKIFNTADLTEDLREILNKERTVYENHW